MKLSSKLLLALLSLLILIQLFRPSKNLGGDHTNDITTKYRVPENINLILEKACNDCHSNTTHYPWYAEVQPIGWWIANHVNEGKDELNFSEFTKRRLASQNHKLEEVIETVKEHEMPLPSYTWFGMHSQANLTDEERVAITDWAAAQMDSLKRSVPADSLVMKRR
ncbi:MAG: heme-binding domain-containing protein [Bacteroidota bacterium]